MKVEINTSVKAVESANCILGQAIKILLDSPEQRENLGLSLTNVKDAHKFRKSLLKGFTKRPRQAIDNSSPTER